MGSWGTGNFDSDSSFEFTAELMDKLHFGIMDLLKGDPDLDYCEYEIVCATEVMCLLAENCKARPPEPQYIDLWQTLYLKSFDKGVCVSYVEGACEERRNIISETFQRLMRLSKAYYSNIRDPFKPNRMKKRVSIKKGAEPEKVNLTEEESDG